MGPSARIFSGMVVSIFFGSAMCILGIVAWALRHWVWLTLASNTPFVLLYSYYLSVKLHTNSNHSRREFKMYMPCQNWDVQQTFQTYCSKIEFPTSELYSSDFQFPAGVASMVGNGRQNRWSGEDIGQGRPVERKTSGWGSVEGGVCWWRLWLINKSVCIVISCFGILKRTHTQWVHITAVLLLLHLLSTAVLLLLHLLSTAVYYYCTY